MSYNQGSLDFCIVFIARSAPVYENAEVKFFSFAADRTANENHSKVNDTKQ